MNWKETFYTGKREHPQEKKPASLTALLMPSLLGVAICLVCLCSPDMGVVHGHPEQRCAAHSVRHCHGDGVAEQYGSG